MGIGCQTHRHYLESCRDCRITRDGCSGADMLHTWEKGRDHCTHPLCGYPKPGWVYSFETLDWPVTT